MYLVEGTDFVNIVYTLTQNSRNFFFWLFINYHIHGVAVSKVVYQMDWICKVIYPTVMWYRQLLSKGFYCNFFLN